MTMLIPVGPMTSAERKRKSRARGKGRQRGGVTRKQMQDAKRRVVATLRTAQAAERVGVEGPVTAEVAPAEAHPALPSAAEAPVVGGPVFAFATAEPKAPPDASVKAA
jgi:hypothetical protein